MQDSKFLKLSMTSQYNLLLTNKLKSLFPINLPRLNLNYFYALLASHIIYYPSPVILTYAWSFGALSGICLIIQMISGIFLSMFYTPHVDLAFHSVEFIMRDVKNGWLIRYIHANGASMFFITVYLHMARGLYYGSYFKPREYLWCSGVIIFILMMATAFTGYVLPWGQMSFWGATVISSMVTAIPFGGTSIVQWVWGAYRVGNPTLKRFYSIHYVLPFLIAAMSLIHLTLLHMHGSNSPVGSDTGIDDVPFYPYFVSKDVFAFFCFLCFFGIFVFYFPNFLNHPHNCIPADPMKTPLHVVPEWYFLTYYAILRSIPSKTGGIAAMGGSIAILLLIPFINTSYVRNTTYRPIFKVFFWFFIANVIILTWIGQKPVKDIFVLIGKLLTTTYFLFFIFIPIIGIIETMLIHYNQSPKYDPVNTTESDNLNKCLGTLVLVCLSSIFLFYEWYVPFVYCVITILYIFFLNKFFPLLNKKELLSEHNRIENFDFNKMEFGVFQFFLIIALIISSFFFNNIFSKMYLFFLILIISTRFLGFKIAQWLPEVVQKNFNQLQKDFITIRYHWCADFLHARHLVYISLISLIVCINLMTLLPLFMSLPDEIIDFNLYIWFVLLLLHIFFSFVIDIYIIFFKNPTTTHKLIVTCVKCFTAGTFSSVSHYQMTENGYIKPIPLYNFWRDVFDLPRVSDYDQLKQYRIMVKYFPQIPVTEYTYATPGVNNSITVSTPKIMGIVKGNETYLMDICTQGEKETLRLVKPTPVNYITINQAINEAINNSKK